MRNKRFRKGSIQPVNLYGFGSDIKKSWKSASGTDKATGLASMASGVMGGVSGGVETGVGNAMSGIGSAMSAIPGIGGMIGAGLSAVGGLVNNMFGSKMNDEFIQQTESNIQTQGNQKIEAATTDEFSDLYGDMTSLGHVSKKDVGKDGWFSNKTAKKTKNLNRQIDDANNRLLESFQNRANNINTQNDLAIAANFADLGGFLSGFGNRKAFGGELGTNGTDWTNGVNLFETGGSHEENPNQGILQGVDAQGVPNLVEEGEVKFKDYIFSNRIKADQEVLDLVGMPKRYKGRKYSDIAKKVSEESKERPNDPISKLGLKDSMLKLQSAQELQRAETQAPQQGNMFEVGGVMDTITSKDWAAGLNAPRFTPQGDMSAIRSQASKYDQPAIDRAKGTGLPTWMRYAPAMGGALGAMAASLTPVDAPNYGNADAIERARQTVGYTPLTQKLTYTPFDREFYANKARAQAGATRRSLENASGGNRATLMAGLMGADAQAQSQMGDMYRQAEEYNQAQKARVAEFNRGTDQANAQMGIQTGMFNAQSRMQAADSAARMRAMEAQRYRGDKAARRDAVSANLTGFIDSLGGIGRENFIMNQISSNPTWAAGYDNNGNLVYKPRAKGGKINRKKSIKLSI